MTKQDGRSQRLNEAIAEYLDAEPTGNAPDRRRILEQNPDLGAFFADHDRMRGVLHAIAC